MQDWFAVDPESGVISVSSKLDRETAQLVILRILVNDTNADIEYPHQTVTGLWVLYYLSRGYLIIKKGNNSS